MSTFDALLMVGIKIIGNVFLNKSESKKEDQRTTPQKIKDEASKAFNETASYTEELKEKAMNWSEEYNTERPHSSLKMKTPKEFLETYDKDKYAVWLKLGLE